MVETIAQHTSLLGALAAALILILVLAFLTAVFARRPRGRQASMAVVAPEGLEPAVEPEQESDIDVSALTTAVLEAERGDEPERLPALYYSLAQRHLQDGEPAEAADLLRKCIRTAARAPHKAVHAKARLVLGDISHAEGDLTTACEHWQIARAIFHELNDKRDHAEAEQRMLSNGCPTDWVLTDF